MKLIENGFKQNEPTLWLMEGLVYYFESEYVNNFLQVHARSKYSGSYINILIYSLYHIVLQYVLQILV